MSFSFSWLRMPATINLKFVRVGHERRVAPRPHFTYQDYLPRARIAGRRAVQHGLVRSNTVSGRSANVLDVVPTQVAGLLEAAATGSSWAYPGGRSVRARRGRDRDGTLYFENMPKELGGASSARARQPHCGALDYSVFAGKSVAALGAGASAVEAAGAGGRGGRMSAAMAWLARGSSSFTQERRSTATSREASGRQLGARPGRSRGSSSTSRRCCTTSRRSAR